MCNFLASINWMELLQTIAALFTLYIAFSALSTWKHQAKAKKQSEFLDEITDKVHEYIQSLSRPLDYLRFIYIAFESHKVPSQGDESNKYAHVINYIVSRGEKDSKIMWEHINNCSSLVAKIESLMIRGQVYDFKNYNTCQDAVKMLLWQHKRLQVVASMIGSPTLNWEHPKVIKGIENMLTVKPDDIVKHLENHDLAFIQFINDNYKRIYAGT